MTIRHRLIDRQWRAYSAGHITRRELFEVMIALHFVPTAEAMKLPQVMPCR